jgi:hypothetical protein
MQDFVGALISFFLIEPLQAEMADKLAGARAPQAGRGRGHGLCSDGDAGDRAASPGRPLVDRDHRLPPLGRLGRARSRAGGSRPGLRARRPGRAPLPDRQAA